MMAQEQALRDKVSGAEMAMSIPSYSLDDVSDGNQYLCITTMNLKDDTVEMRFYPR